MRITVYDVLDYLASGMTIEEILDDFPYLTQVRTFKEKTLRKVVSEKKSCLGARILPKINANRPRNLPKVGRSNPKLHTAITGWSIRRVAN